MLWTQRATASGEHLLVQHARFVIPAPHPEGIGQLECGPESVGMLTAQVAKSEVAGTHGMAARIVLASQCQVGGRDGESYPGFHEGLVGERGVERLLGVGE